MTAAGCSVSFLSPRVILFRLLQSAPVAETLRLKKNYVPKRKVTGFQGLSERRVGCGLRSESMFVWKRLDVCAVIMEAHWLLRERADVSLWRRRGSMLKGVYCFITLKCSLW